MEVPVGDTYYIKFTSRSFSTGAPTTLAGTPVISVYEEANLTQITAGITLTADYDSVTGLNDVAIVATSANGYEVGKYYSAVITTGTVGGVSVVGEVVGHFRVMPAEDAGAGIKDVNTTHVSDTAQTANDNGLDINTLITQIGTAGAGLTDLGGMSTAMKAEVNAEADTALSDMFTSSAQLVDDIWDETQSAHLTADTTGLYSALAGGILVDTTITGTPTGTTFQLTAGSAIDDFYNDQLIYIISGTGVGQVRVVTDYTGATKLITVDEAWTTTPAAADRVVLISTHIHTVSQIADGVWDEATSGHSTAGTTGKALTDALADTNELQGDWADGGRLDLIVDELTTQGDTNESKIDIIDTNVDAVLVDTAEIGTAGAGLTAVPWNASWDAEVQSECTDALNAYDPPTNAEMEARTPTASELAYIVNHAKTAPSVTFTGGTTTTAVLGNVDGSAASSVDDFYNGRILIFNAGTLDEQATDITDYVGATKTATITAVTTAVTSSHTAILV